MADDQMAACRVAPHTERHLRHRLAGRRWPRSRPHRPSHLTGRYRHSVWDPLAHEGNDEPWDIKLALVEGPNVLITLEDPVTVAGPYGFKKTVSTIALLVEENDRLLALPVPGPSDGQSQ